MKILITGSDGYIGSHTAKALTDHDLTLWGRDLDLTQPWSSIEEFDVIIHLAARVGVKYFTKDYESYKNNYEVDHQFINALRKCHKQPKVIYASTSEVMGANRCASETDNFNIFHELRGSYALEKANTEMQLRAFADNFTIVRFFNVTGDDHTDRHGHVLPVFVKNALEGKPLHLHNGGSDVRTFCYIDDVAKALKFIAEHPTPDVINVGSCLRNNTVTIKELAEMVKSFVPDAQFIVDGESQRIAMRSPNVLRLTELGVECTTTLMDIVKSSVNFYRKVQDVSN